MLVNFIIKIPSLILLFVAANKFYKAESKIDECYALLLIIIAEISAK